MNLKNSYIIELKRAAMHVLFWCAVSVFFAYIIGVDNTIDSNVFYFSLFLMPVTIGTTYVSIYYLIPNYLITKRYSLFIIYSLYTLIISVFTILLSIFYGFAFLSNFEFAEMSAINRSGVFIITCIYLVVILVSAFKLLKLNLGQSKHNADLKVRIYEAQLKLKEQELQYLKMQIQPHFLFNTLNTLYGFALKKADETPEVVLKLSNLLDYILYQVDKPYVELSEEINHIRDYIALEKMRFNDTLDINLKDNTSENNLKIAPMLFLPFVENSFKHGAIVDGKLQIDIEILNENNILTFVIENTVNEIPTASGGIGLENITKRLELLYKDKYSLKILPEAGKHKVQLTLNTSNA